MFIIIIIENNHPLQVKINNWCIIASSVHRASSSVASHILLCLCSVFCIRLVHGCLFGTALFTANLYC